MCSNWKHLLHSMKKPQKSQNCRNRFYFQTDKIMSIISVIGNYKEKKVHSLSIISIGHKLMVILFMYCQETGLS